jgi:hypothetical protein
VDVSFGRCVLIRRVAFGGCVLIRGEAFGGCVLIREGPLHYLIIIHLFFSFVKL